LNSADDYVVWLQNNRNDVRTFFIQKIKSGYFIATPCILHAFLDRGTFAIKTFNILCDI